MSFFIVDVESDGPIPSDFSMVCFGAVRFDDDLTTAFFGRTRPISERFVPEALAISGYSRVEHASFEDPKTVHTHNPVDDARGNAEALLKIRELGLRI